MSLKRVVVTGLGAVSPYGAGMELFTDSLRAGRGAVRPVPELAAIQGLRARVAALVPELDAKIIPRKFRRSMTSMSVFAYLACREALARAGLGEEECRGGRLGIVLGSTVGSIAASESFFADFFVDRSLERMKSGLFFQIMNHSCAANVAQALGIAGRILAPAAACSTGCQAIGYGAETIALGKQDWLLCGGADEFHPLTAATFDVMNAGSARYNDDPERTPRPFDRGRDGVVCAEGCGILLLESLDSALARGAEILAEVTGFATLSAPSNIANPDAEAIARCMTAALADAGVTAADIDYVNAHATGTDLGDRAEAESIYRLFGDRVPVSSLKGHIGHAMAASGSLELAACVAMLGDGRLIPTRNLDRVDPECAPIRHVRGLEAAPVNTILKNNFALGGVNSSIVLRRYRHD
ncbi:beta-ketoacyl-[acyl-carrier-protein] synthase family protein [Desulfuromonas acetexigens]|uniref:Beta-ketoacyl-[acyl-carrier-protein] synthase family protein n=1 Tax=Trichloromonas acetexigens TaxID=38815 RepID=A0A550JF99_9BACT|nr:beta-ketoacyl-[acyl-carrier-protein] synthase family protein [Desulfuromonas acetexigens]TRO81881.1 beta-ketoacyl-[acyl-carrier-protein] synthase family protein [Desulfuromonas acetexigens]